MTEEKILVSPGEGQTLQDLAKDLLALADNPHDVDYSPRTGGFTVPESLAGRYAFSADSSTAAEVSAAEEAKPGRARRSRAPAKGAAEKKARNPRSRQPAKGAAKASAEAGKDQAKDGGKKDGGGVNDA